MRLRRYANPESTNSGSTKSSGRISEAAYLLYKVIASRNQKRFTALLTSVDFDKWGDYLSDGPLTMASLTVWSKE